MNKQLKRNFIGAGIAVLIGSTAITAEASHFRGGAMVPSIENGILTVVQTTFWRKTTAGSNTPTVTGVGGMALQSSVTDTSDSRYDRRTNVYTVNISTATQGILNITAGSCCRVNDGGLGNWIESSWNLDAAINWDGSNADPINFNFGTIQPEVSRLPGNDYFQGLNASSPDGLTLTYNQDLNLNITSQVPGFTVNTTTGQMSIVGDANRAQITDNLTTVGSTTNVGADAAFSGNILASDGSFVEFDWMFDGIDAAVNQAPTVTDAVINALIGPGPIIHTFTATDPEDGALTAAGDWDPFLVLGAGFVNALPTFNTATQMLSWDTTGYAPGQYLIQARAFDSVGVGDFGLLTVNLCANLNDPPCGTAPPPPPPPPGGVPIPGTLFLFGIGLAGLGWRLGKKKQ